MKPGASPTTLADIFNLNTNPLSLVIAALFGLTPGLLLGELSKQGDAVRSALASTNAGATQTVHSDQS